MSETVQRKVEKALDEIRPNIQEMVETYSS
jgi:hypothetical protein